MKKILLKFFIIYALIVVFSISCIEKNCFASNESEIANEFVKLFNDNSRTTRIEAYYISVGLPKNEKLVWSLRSNIKFADAVERIIILYAIAAITRLEQDIKKFLLEFPQKSELFYKLMDVEWGLSATLNTGIADFLLMLGYEEKFSCLAMKNLAYIVRNISGESMNKYHDDRVFMSFVEKNNLDDFEIKEVNDFEKFPKNNTCKNIIIKMVLGKNEIDSHTAMLIYDRTFVDHYLDKVISAKIVNSKYKYFLSKRNNINNLIKYFPTDEHSVRDLLNFEKSTYRLPINGVASLIYAVLEPSPTKHDINILRAILQYGSEHLEEYDKVNIKHILKGH